MRRRKHTSWNLRRFRFSRAFHKTFSEGVGSALDISGQTARGYFQSEVISPVEAIAQDARRIGQDASQAVGKIADESE